MQNFLDLKNPYHFIASLGGIGLIPFAPGTFGSIFAWVIFIVLSHFMNMFVLTLIAIFFAIWICDKAIKNLIEKDHKSIVIDELVGMWIALIPVIYIAYNQKERIIYAILAILLFRIFDILKPYPISYFDKKLKNGFGIVLDDCIAGIFSGIGATFITILLI
tara:strand:+ start:568 stop:1053 length:486 start_codon:yes stop_codon:yes gene_type:complete